MIDRTAPTTEDVVARLDATEEALAVTIGALVGALGMPAPFIIFALAQTAAERGRRDAARVLRELGKEFARYQAEAN